MNYILGVQVFHSNSCIHSKNYPCALIKKFLFVQKDFLKGSIGHEFCHSS
uniref:Uncharacterized protein n=1 Tax=Arundo donax TaxID=35708 RepID=A0A0A9CDX0_ARUDO